MGPTGTMKKRRRVALIALLLAIAGIAFVAGPADAVVPPDGAAVVYSATQVAPPPPSPTFTASAGGDGWDMAFYGSNVYTVFHHQFTFKVACRDMYTTNQCTGYTKTITDPVTSDNFTTSYFERMWIDQSTGHLFAWAVQSNANTAGVLEIDLNSSAANPFVSFIAASAVGESQSGMQSLSNPVMFGTKWYAFHFRSGTHAGTQDTMMCVDLATLTTCAGQPYALPDIPATVGNAYQQQPPQMSPIGSRVIMPLGIDPNTFSDYSGSLYCFDMATNGSCSGSWPVTPTAPASTNVMGTPAGIPALDLDGVQTGVCLESFDPTATDSVHPNVWCYDPTGAFMAAESASIGAVVNGSAANPFNGAPVVLGTRVVIAQGNDWHANGNWDSQVVCFDWATGAQCPNYPRNYSGQEVSYVYNVVPSPGYPSCIWQMADAGTTQMLTFDAFEGTACGTGGIRVQMDQFVSPVVECRPTSYTSLTITSPLPSAYTGGTVSFQDPQAQPISGATSLPIVNGVVDLSALDLSTAHGLPQMLIDLPGATGESIAMSIEWAGDYHDPCVAQGQTVQYDPPTTTTTTTVGPTDPTDPVGPAFAG